MLLQTLMDWLSKFDTEEEGQGLVEYALVLILVSVAAIVTLRVIGGDIAGLFTIVSGALTGA